MSIQKRRNGSGYNHNNPLLKGLNDALKKELRGGRSLNGPAKRAAQAVLRQKGSFRGKIGVLCNSNYRRLSEIGRRFADLLHSNHGPDLLTNAQSYLVHGEVPDDDPHWVSYDVVVPEEEIR